MVHQNPGALKCRVRETQFQNSPAIVLASTLPRLPDGGTLGIEAKCRLVNGNALLLYPDTHAGQYVVLNVTDTATGMSPEILDRIFDSLQ